MDKKDQSWHKRIFDPISQLHDYQYPTPRFKHAYCDPVNKLEVKLYLSSVPFPCRSPVDIVDPSFY